MTRFELKGRVRMKTKSRMKRQMTLSHSTTRQLGASRGMLAISSCKGHCQHCNNVKKSWVLHKGTGEMRNDAASMHNLQGDTAFQINECRTG